MRARSDDLARTRASDFNAKMTAAIVSAWAHRIDKTRHPDPERAARFAFMIAVGLLREFVLFSEYWPSERAPSPAELSREITAAIIAYLEHAEPSAAA